MRPSINYIRVACLRFMKSKSNSCFYEKGVSCQFKVIKHKKKGKQILWDIKIFQKCCWAITEQNFCSRSSSLNSVPGNKDFLTVKFSPSHRAAPQAGLCSRGSQFPGLMLGCAGEVGPEVAAGPGQVSSPLCSKYHCWE